MDIYPAIDIRGGRVVRLSQGEAHRETAYDDDPVAMAERFAWQGARWIHIVDLDRAFGDGDNTDVIDRIAVRVGSYLQIQLGGGFRTADRLRHALQFDVTRIVLGTAVVDRPGFLEEAIALCGADRLAVGIDARDGFVALRGWQHTTTLPAADLAARVAAAGIRTVIYTDIARDGMLTGVNVPACQAIQAQGPGVIASGGVASLADVRAVLAGGLAGVVVGRALYEGRFTLAQALEVAGTRA